MKTPTAPETLASFLLLASKGGDLKHNIAAVRHRQNLVERWQIKPGSSVLELGCGQGDCTVVLADAVGPSGHVTGVDPAPLDYGTPPMKEGRDFLLASPLGSRITFVPQDPLKFLSETQQRFDYVVMCHCIWYFAHPKLLKPVLSAAYGKADQLLIAEYSLQTSNISAVPHVLCSFAANALESIRDDPSTKNIRCALTPKQITDYAHDSGWKIADSCEIEPVDGQLDGFREVWMLMNGHFDREVGALKNDGKVKSMLRGAKDAVNRSFARLQDGLESVTNMDTWVATLEKAS